MQALKKTYLLWITSTLTLIFCTKITGIYGNECSDGEVSCENGGECVPLERQCDGVPDCPGYQDENIELCNNKGCTRNDFLSGDPFRCKYGACINQLFKCNGIANCVDGSDETPQLCASKRCGRREFKCEYGACINRRRKCDGISSCYYDGSDETLEACGDKRCSSSKFRCNYGACIFDRKKCDGKADCIDGSDETEDVCGSGHSIAILETTPTAIATTTTSIATIPTSNPTTVKTSSVIVETATTAVPVDDATTTVPLQTITPTKVPTTTTEHPKLPETKCLPVDLLVTLPITPDESFTLSHTHTFVRRCIGVNNKKKACVPKNQEMEHWIVTKDMNSAKKESILVSWASHEQCGYQRRRCSFEMARKCHEKSPTHYFDEVHCNCACMVQINGTDTCTAEYPLDSGTSSNPGIPVVYPSNSNGTTVNSGTTVCPSNLCQCPQQSQHLCLPCSPNFNQTCVAIERNISCHLTNNFEENVEVDVLDCGAPEYIQIESLQRKEMACNYSFEAPVLTTVLVDCWKTKQFLAQCHHDGLWHSYQNEEIPLIFTPIKNLCQQENVNAPACGITPRFDPDPNDGFTSRDRENPYILGSYLYQPPWPWLVGIFRENKFYCTGTLITPHYILTAAHCLARSQESSIALDVRDIKIQRYNDSDFGDRPEYPVQWISKIIIYPEFVPGSRPIHDIALVKLEEPVLFNKYTYPACVRTKDLNQSLTGWTFNRTEGEEDYNWIEFEQQMDPSCQTKETLNRAEGCNRTLNVHQHQFCAINNEIDKWLYPGSSGGPFLVNAGSEVNELWEVAGIVSSSVNDNVCDVPYTIFTDVSAYINWISNCVNYNRCSLINQ